MVFASARSSPGNEATRPAGGRVQLGSRQGDDCGGHHNTKPAESPSKALRPRRVLPNSGGRAIIVSMRKGRGAPEGGSRQPAPDSSPGRTNTGGTAATSTGIWSAANPSSANPGAGSVQLRSQDAPLVYRASTNRWFQSRRISAVGCSCLAASQSASRCNGPQLRFASSRRTRNRP